MPLLLLRQGVELSGRSGTNSFTRRDLVSARIAKFVINRSSGSDKGRIVISSRATLQAAALGRNAQAAVFQN